MSVRNTWQVGHATAFLPHYFMPEGQFCAKRFSSLTGLTPKVWFWSKGVACELARKATPLLQNHSSIGSGRLSVTIFLFSLAMRHHILPEKLYNILVINQTNLFIQKDDEVRNKFGASVKHVTKTTDRRIYHCRNPQGGSELIFHHHVTRGRGSLRSPHPLAMMPEPPRGF